MLPDGSSSESLRHPPRKLHQLPFAVGWEESSASLTNISQLASLDPSAPLNLTDGQLDEILAELKNLESACQQRLQVLASQKESLSRYLADELYIDNVDEWLEKHKDDDEEPVQPADRTVAESQASTGTTLRLKLSTGPPPPNVPRQPGTGSKNLSRMNRPSEKNFDAHGKGKGASNQVPINVFWNYVEPFFKPIEEAELKFLDDPNRVIDPTPFSIPPLGRPYAEQWRETYGFQVGSHEVSLKRRLDAGLMRPSLRERLLSMLIEESLLVPEDQIDFGDDDELEVLSDAGAVITPTVTATAGLEVDQVKLDQRIRREMVSLGLEEFAGVDDAQEDDEICRELRALQQRLRYQVCLNHYRKKKLAEVARSRLPAQEFYSLLSEVDRQIEHLYQRRIKGPKKRKSGGAPLIKRSSSISTAAGQDSEPNSGTSSVPPEASSLPAQFKILETRQALITHFRDFIPPLKEVLATSTPENPLFPEAEEEAVTRLAEEQGSWLPIPEHLVPLSLSRPLPTTQPVFPNLLD